MRIVIPARTLSERLPYKPFKLIGDKPLIVHCWESAMATGLPVTILADDEEMFNVVPQADIILTGEAESGTHRIAMVADEFEEDTIINLQGDIPFITPKQILSSVHPLHEGFDVGTLIHESDRLSVSALCTPLPMIEFNNHDIYRAHWFIRQSVQDGWGHIGVYAFRKDTLKEYVKNSITKYHENEKLEQLKWFELGFTIGATLTTEIPCEVNDELDLEFANRYYSETR